MTNLKLKNFSLFLVDSIIFFSSLYLTLYSRYYLFGPETMEGFKQRLASHLPHFFLVFCLLIIVLYINHLYNLRLINSFKKLSRLSFSSLGLSLVLATLYFYLNVSANIAPRTNLLLFFLIYSILFLAWRYLFFQIIRTRLGRNQVAIIGNNHLTDKLIESLKQNPNLGYQLNTVVQNTYDLYNLKNKIKQEDVRHIVFTDHLNNDQETRAILFKLLPEKLNFFSYPEFYEILTEKIPVEAINQEWFLNNLKEASKNYYNFTKRFLEIILSFILLIISLPFWPIIALIIKLDSKGPVFFQQDRLGRQGQIFSIKKFRSMRAIDNDLSPTRQKDKRITKVGKFLRITRLDELPQLIHILKGEMSFIGPRPERPEIVKQLEEKIPFYKTRLLVKPGLTGWDQVSGEYHSPSIEDSLEKLQYDLYYIKNRSLYLDANILLKTISTVFSRGGR